MRTMINLILILTLSLWSCDDPTIDPPTPPVSEEDSIELIWTKTLNDSFATEGIGVLPYNNFLVHMLEKNDNYYLVVRDRETGEELIRSGRIEISSLVEREVKYFIYKNYFIINSHSHNTCIDLNTGAIHWHHEFGIGGGSNQLSYGGNYQIVYKGKYYTSETFGDFYKPDSMTVVEFDIETGNRKNIYTDYPDSTEYGPGLRHMGMRKNQLGERILYIGVQELKSSTPSREFSNLVAFNIESKEIEWENKNVYQHKDAFWANGGLIEFDTINRLMYTMGRHAICFNMDSGERIWTYDMSGNGISDNGDWELYNDRICFFTGQGHFVSLNRFNGAPMYKVTSSSNSEFKVEPNGIVVTGGWLNNLKALDVESGEMIWHVYNPMKYAEKTSPPYIDWDNGKMYYADRYFIHCAKIPDKLY